MTDRRTEKPKDVMLPGDEIAARIRSLENVVRSLEEESRRAERELRRLSERRIEQEIEPGLGVVVVDVQGGLHEIRLNRPELRNTRAGALGQRIQEAIETAERRAADLRARHVRKGAPGN